MKAESSTTSTEKEDVFPPLRPGCGSMDPPIFLTNILLGIWFVLTLRRLSEGEENPFFGNPILLTFALTCRHVFVSADKSPKDSVYEYYHRDGRKASKLVCLGDSITQGACSSSFVDNLRCHDACRGMDVVNAGLNAITSWTVANKRVYDLIRLKPDFVSIMIGTNDARGHFHEPWANELVFLWKLKVENPFSLENYEKNLEQIVNVLLESTDAVIAVCSLPPIGEDFDSKVNQTVIDFNKIIHQVVERKKVNKFCDRLHFLDVFQVLRERCDSSNESAPSIFKMLLYFTVIEFLYHLLRVPRKYGSKIFGMSLLSDTVHLNENGADEVAEIISQWILRNTKKK